MSTKSKAWKEFKQVKDELLSKYNASERAKITKPLMRALLGQVRVKSSMRKMRVNTIMSLSLFAVR